MFNISQISKMYTNNDTNPIIKKNDDFNNNELLNIQDYINNHRFPHHLLELHKYIIASHGL